MGVKCRASVRLAIGLGLVAVLAVAGCARPMQHVREAGRFSPETVAQAEAALRSIAERTGFYAFIVIEAEGRPVDPPRVFGPIMEEVGQRGGSAYVLIKHATGSSNYSSAFSPDLQALYRAELLPVIAQGLGINPDPELVEWVRDIGEVAELHAR